MLRRTGFWKLACRMNGKQLLETVRKIARRSGKNKVFLFFDVLYCGVAYGAGYQDYWLYEFEKLTRAQRRTYVTRGFNNRMVCLLNDKEKREQFSDKGNFNRRYQDLMGRAFLDLTRCREEDFLEFVKKHQVFAAKPPKGCCGKGFERVEAVQDAEPMKMLRRLQKEGKTIVEEYLSQHPALEKLHPSSINTLRIGTMNHSGTVTVVYGFLRIGNHGNVVDNINSGGMCAPIDLDTGVIAGKACDKNGKAYERHPVSGATIEGAEIPFWRDSLKLCVQAAGRAPEIGYIGWDVCVTPQGPVLVEGNEFPGHDILQLPEHTPKKVGMKPVFLKLVPELG